MTESYRAYPLTWPDGYPRTKKTIRARFDDWTVHRSREELEHEIRLFGGKDLIVSSNLELKLDGTPRSGQKQPSDTGVAIYFTRNNVNFSMPEDLYDTVNDNLHALVLTLQNLRGIERWGGVHMVERAFKGFTQLPDPNTKEWWEELHLSRDSSLELVSLRHKELAKQYHPDNKETGDADMFIRIQSAYEKAKKEKE
jgi:hypothetical protein